MQRLPWMGPKMMAAEGDPSSLPLRRMTLSYARNLLGVLAFDEPLLQFVLPRLSPAGKEALLSFVLSGFSDEPAMHQAETLVENIDRGQTAAMVRWMLDSIDTPVNGLTAANVEECLSDLLDREMAAIGPTSAGTEDAGIASVRQVYRLSDDDVALLMLAICYHQYHTLETLCDSFRCPEKFTLLSTMAGIPVRRLLASGGRNGRLVRCGILDVPNFGLPGTFFDVNRDIVDFVLGISLEPLSALFCRRVEGAAYGADEFGIPSRAVEITRTLLGSNKPCSILLYGEPGTGKTEFAKSIARACGKSACFVLMGDTGENKDRRPALVAAASIVAPADGVVVVDEADALLNSRYAFIGAGDTGSLRKEWLNDFLDCCQALTIWIVNDTSCIEESTRRRFGYAVEFKGHSATHRERVWRAHLKDHPLQSAITPGLVRELSRDFRVNAAGIANALTTVRHAVPAPEGQPGTVRAALRDILASHEKLTGHERHGKLAGLATEYDPDAVNASVKPGEIVRALGAFASDAGRSDQPPANLLFWGLPGTGKTAFAQYLAQTLGLELLIKRASDLLSMWVGGTEHNIRDAFEEAERENAILFLDEADSFFIDRQTAMHSWESTQTNELLTQMENHHGILICCTNLLDDLDHAAMRRFNWKVRFLPLTAEGKVRLFRRYFLERSRRLPGALRKRLERIPDLTPGDIKAVWQRLRLQAEPLIDQGQIVTALEEELAYRKTGVRVTGFH